ncbi:MAG: hypothetical protein E6K13_02120 [Methanobacteriota archaeon]|nr:MAG: hypothetical protein E6K13_02120 [Euryarchaeota archaeon]
MSIETRPRSLSVGAGETGDGSRSPPASKRPRGLLIAGYSVAGLLHLAVASLTTRVTEIPLSAQFGLLQLLPPAYWIGMGLLGLATVLALRERSDALTLVTGALLLAAIAGTPSLFEPNPRYWDSYLHLSLGQAIQGSGHLPAGNLGQYSANWPGTFLLDAFVLLASGMPAILLLTVYPFLTGAITFLALFVFIRSTFPRPVAGPATVLTSLFAVWAQYHLSPQSLGFIVMLLILSIIWRGATRWRAVCAVLFVGLVVSHPTSTLVLLSILAVLSISSLFPLRKSPEAKQDARFARRVTVAYATTWFAWLFFHATASSEAARTAILNRIGGLISLPEATLNLATARAVENLLPLAPLLRLGSLAIYGLLAIPSLIILARREASRPLARFLLAGLIGPGIIGGADILGFGGQFYDRPLLFFSTLAPAMCLTALQGIRIRLPKIAYPAVAAVLIAATLVAASTVYYQEAFNHVSNESVAISQFLDRTPPQAIVLDGTFPVPVWIDPTVRTPHVLVGYAQTYRTPLQNMSARNVYAVFDPTSELWYRQWKGINIYAFYDSEQPSLSVIYSNGRGVVCLAGAMR